MKPLLYFENFLTEEEAKRLEKYIISLPLSQDIYKIYGKEIKSPRLTCFLSEISKNYTYSGQTKESIFYSEEIKDIARKIEAFLNVPPGYFNGCLVNLYRDGYDSISYHKDNEPDMSKDTLIAVISIGAKRNFCLKEDCTGEVTKYPLTNCSLAVMTNICQKDYQHAILKEKKINEKRISLTFRNFNMS